MCYDKFHKVEDIVAIKYFLRQEYVEKKTRPKQSEQQERNEALFRG